MVIFDFNIGGKCEIAGGSGFTPSVTSPGRNLGLYEDKTNGSIRFGKIKLYLYTGWN